MGRDLYAKTVGSSPMTTANRFQNIVNLDWSHGLEELIYKNQTIAGTASTNTDIRSRDRPLGADTDWSYLENLNEPKVFN